MLKKGLPKTHCISHSGSSFKEGTNKIISNYYYLEWSDELFRIKDSIWIRMKLSSIYRVYRKLWKFNEEILYCLLHSKILSDLIIPSWNIIKRFMLVLHQYFYYYRIHQKYQKKIWIILKLIFKNFTHQQFIEWIIK